MRISKSSDVYFDAKIGELYPAHCLSWTLDTGPPELLSAGVSRQLPPRQLTRSLGPGSAAAVAAVSRLAAAVRRCIDWQQQPGSRGRPAQAECALGSRWAHSTTGDRGHEVSLSFIETTPTHHTSGGAFLPFLIYSSTISFTKFINKSKLPVYSN